MIDSVNVHGHAHVVLIVVAVEIVDVILPVHDHVTPAPLNHR